MKTILRKSLTLRKKLWPFGKKSLILRFHNGRTNMFVNTSEANCFFYFSNKRMWAKIFKET